MSGQSEPALEPRFSALVAAYRPALQRLVSATEFDPDRRRDLLQEMLLALWRALPSFEGRSSERTWVFRIAHNVAATAVVRARRDRLRKAVHLEELDDPPVEADTHQVVEARARLQRIAQLVERLVPLDQQVLLLYLEGLSAQEISEVTGLTAGAVATKVHRIKALLTRQVREQEGA